MAQSPLVTIAALYGTDGDVVGARLAERLGVAFLDRALPEDVARAAGIPDDRIEAFEDPGVASVGRVVTTLARTANPATAPDRRADEIDYEEGRIRAEMEAFLASAGARGGVVLGRGAAVVLKTLPGSLHVYLGGSFEERVRRVSDDRDLSEREAERLVRAHDRARIDYVSGAYGVDGTDPDLYHLMINAIALGVDHTVEIIASAATTRLEDAG